eukprot:1474977-Pyramimonas_sp.AAC.2
MVVVSGVILRAAQQPPRLRKQMHADSANAIHLPNQLPQSDGQLAQIAQVLFHQVRRQTLITSPYIHGHDDRPWNELADAFASTHVAVHSSAGATRAAGSGPQQPVNAGWRTTDTRAHTYIYIYMYVRIWPCAKNTQPTTSAFTR